MPLREGRACVGGACCEACSLAAHLLPSQLQLSRGNARPRLRRRARPRAQPCDSLTKLGPHRCPSDYCTSPVCLPLTPHNVSCAMPPVFRECVCPVVRVRTCVTLTDCLGASRCARGSPSTRCALPKRRTPSCRSWRWSGAPATVPRSIVAYSPLRAPSAPTTLASPQRERRSRRLWSLECAGPCCLQAGRHRPPIQPLQVCVPRRAHVALLRAPRRADAPLHCARVWAASLHRHAAADVRLPLRGSGRPAGCVTRHTERQGAGSVKDASHLAPTCRETHPSGADSPTCRW